MLWMYAYKNGSRSARALANNLGIRKIAHEGSRYRHRPNKRVLNWGCGDIQNPEVMRGPIINSPSYVQLASNKRTFFRQMQTLEGVHIPDSTESFDTALEWVEEGHLVVARTVLQGHSGRGIHLMSQDNPDGFVRAPLYTKYIKKRDEYRVHVAFNEVIDVQRKALSSEAAREEVDWKIRNHDNGFIYAREGVSIPDDVKQQCINCIDHLGLDFGAVDLIYNSHYNRYYILEVNTAPGLEGTTLERYTEAFRECA